MSTAEIKKGQEALARLRKIAQENIKRMENLEKGVPNPPRIPPKPSKRTPPPLPPKPKKRTPPSLPPKPKIEEVVLPVEDLYTKYYDPSFYLQVQFDDFIAAGLKIQELTRINDDWMDMRAQPIEGSTDVLLNGERIPDVRDALLEYETAFPQLRNALIKAVEGDKHKYILYSRFQETDGSRKIYMLNPDFIQKLFLSFGVVSVEEVYNAGSVSDAIVLYAFSNPALGKSVGKFAVIPVRNILNTDVDQMAREGTNVWNLVEEDADEVLKEKVNKIAQKIKNDREKLRKNKKRPESEIAQIEQRIREYKKEQNRLRREQKPKAKKKVKENSGNYIKYAHTSDYNLNRLQILHEDAPIEEYKKVTAEHCFVSSLIEAGNMNDPKYATFIAELRPKIVGQFKSSCISQLLPEWLQIKCVKYNPDMTKRGKTYTYKSTPSIRNPTVVKIFLYQEHYMPELIKEVNGKKVRASAIVRELYKKGQFVLSKYHIYEKDVLEDDTILTDEMLKQDQTIFEYKPPSHEAKEVFFADFESLVHKEKMHRAFLFGICGMEGEPIVEVARTNENLNTCSIFTDGLDKIIAQRKARIELKSKQLSKDFLETGISVKDYEKKKDEIKKERRQKFLLYFHNLKYDFSLLVKNPKIKIMKELNRKGQVYSVVFRYMTYEFCLYDSYKIIGQPLDKFNETFKLGDIGKLKFALYQIVDSHNFNQEYIPLDEFKIMLHERENKSFIESDYTGYIRDNKYYHMEHYKDYLKMDCLTLRAGMLKMREFILHITELDIFNYLTISAVGFQFAKKSGCLNGVATATGNFQKFLQKFVIGGRVALRHNEKQLIHENIQNFDACGLYLTSLSIMTVPKGKAVLIKDKDLLIEKEVNTPEGIKIRKYLNPEVFCKYTQYFIACKIKLNKTQQIPMVSVKNPKTLVREWVNDVADNVIYLDKMGIEDVIKYHDAEMLEIIQAVGYPWINGTNELTNKMALCLHHARNGAKAEKNDALSDAYKLVGNSIYGKSLLVDCDVEIHHRHGHDEFASYVNNNYHRIRSTKQYGANNDSYRFKCRKNIIGNTNFILYGCCVLSQSKRIMNEVMGIANDNNIDVYYTDCDSIHMKESDVEKLGRLFTEQYGRELIGDDLRKFHNDFKSKKLAALYKAEVEHAKENGLEKPIDVLHSVKFIGLGKKCYLHILENAHGQRDYYARFKGANIENLNAYCKKNNMSLEELYESFHRNEEHEINIADGKVRFKFTENGVSTVDTMIKYFGFDSNDQRQLRQKERNRLKKNNLE